jgi:hypothetical protein
MTNCNHLQSGHSAFFKKKSTAKKCIKLLRKDKGQTRLRLRKVNHTLRGKGWLVEA